MATKIGNVNGLPRSNKSRVLSSLDVAAARLNNQFFIAGTNPVFPGNFPNDLDIIVFLEVVQSTGTFTIEGVAGVISGALSSPFLDSRGLLRLDGGVKLNGTILGAKGFFLPVK